MNQKGLTLKVLAAFVFVVPMFLADPPKPIKAEKEFRGSVADANLAKLAPANQVIASKTALEKLWKAWGIKEAMPELDHTKELILVATSVGSRLNVSASLKDNGDLQVMGITTSDFGEGFRYHIILIKSEGVKTVGGKPLPKS